MSSEGAYWPVVSGGTVDGVIGHEIGKDKQ